MKQSATVFTILALVFSVFSMISCENQKKVKHESTDDKEMAEEMNEEKFETRESEKKADFLVNAVAANLAELEMAEMAINKSGNDEIRSLGRQLNEDHSLILRELKTFAEKRGVTVPERMSDSDSTDIEKIRAEKQVDFDKKWLMDMEDRHESSLKKYGECAEDAEDIELQNLANRHIVMIESHHQMIEKLLEKY